ncbi:MAG TPA: CoA pyrophosphatase [Solirubrobacterales bacterium]|nr:CoA pyrophosphatase [Solirubrobacterales bacterium]
MEGPAGSLRSALLTPEEARTMNAPGGTEAAVLVAMYGHPDRPGLVFTERRAELRRHAGEISFPGGRQDDPDEDLLRTALREAEEEIGLAPDEVDVIGALPPVGTFVTGYKVHPFVGLIAEGMRFRPNPNEVAAVLLFGIDELRAGFAMRRLVRRGIPIRTPTYEVGEHMIWGATARILGGFLERLEPSR